MDQYVIVDANGNISGVPTERRNERPLTEDEVISRLKAFASGTRAFRLIPAFIVNRLDPVVTAVRE
jgi:hypothetical protein